MRGYKRKEFKKRQFGKRKRRREEEGGIWDYSVKIPREYILENDTRIRRGYFLYFLSPSIVKRKNKII